MKKNESGSALLVSLIFIVVLSLIGGTVLQNMLPRFSATARTTGWQEAIIASEAGMDIALAEINGKLPELTTASWTGWKRLTTNGTAGADATGSDLAPQNIDTQTAAGRTGLALSRTIVRDNMPVTSAEGIPAMVDVQVTALYPTPGNPKNVWLRIRAMGTAALPGGDTTAGIDPLESSLRRLSLQTRRASLGSEDINLPQSIPLPNSSRTIELLVRPVRAFNNAITTEGYMELPNSNNFHVDSFDSSDSKKSTNGLYVAAKRQNNGHLASNGTGEDGNPISGAQIDVNGRTIYGDVLTNGGEADGLNSVTTTNPDGTTTTTYSNVKGDVKDDFQQDLPVILPENPLPNFQIGNTFVAGAPGAPKSYKVGNTGAITITAPTGATVANPGQIIIVIDGNLNVGTGNNAFIKVPANVKAKIYVSGNVNLGNGDINSKTTDSRRATNLQIFCYGDSGTFVTNGNPNVYAAVYAPTYDISIKGGGNGAWYGSVVGKTVKFNGGGASAFHFDEALGKEGPIQRFEITRYHEDMRR